MIRCHIPVSATPRLGFVTSYHPRPRFVTLEPILVIGSISIKCAKAQFTRYVLAHVHNTCVVKTARLHDVLCTYVLPNLHLFSRHLSQGRRRRGGRGGTSPPPPPTFKSGGTSGFVPPPLLGRANVLISLFVHILWLKTHFFFQNFLGSLRSPTLINQYFLNFANLKL